MVTRKQLAGALGALVIALATFGAASGPAFAHARYVSHEPALGAAFDGSPVLLKVNFSQELRLASMVKVSDANGAQVDMGDGRVDQDDPDRKAMLVSLPQLASGVYTVEYIAVSAEDDHSEYGSFAVGVGTDPPAAESTTPASAPAAKADTPTTTVAAGRSDCPATANVAQ